MFMENNPIISIKVVNDNIEVENNSNPFPIIDYDEKNKEVKINPLDNIPIKVEKPYTPNKSLDIVSEMETENGLKVNVCRSFLEAIKAGRCFEIIKKENACKPPYCYFSDITLQFLLYLVNPNSYPVSKLPIEGLIPKHKFKDFFADLTYTNLKSVIFIEAKNERTNLFRSYDNFIKTIEHKIDFGEENHDAKCKDMFYETIRGCFIGLYSTEESFLQYSLFEEYKAILSEYIRGEESTQTGLLNFILSPKKFSHNKILDDVLDEYLSDFQNDKLAFSEQKIKQIERFVLETNKEVEGSVYSSGLTFKKKEDISSSHYLKYKTLIEKLEKIFGKAYNEYGAILKINQKLFGEDNSLYTETEKISFEPERVRFCELLLVLEKQGYIEIEDVEIINSIYNFRVHFKQSPKDIAEELTKSEIILKHKDLVIKIINGEYEVLYKDLPVKTYGKLEPKNFKTLEYLMTHELSVDINKVYKTIEETKDDMPEKDRWGNNRVGAINKFFGMTGKRKKNKALYLFSAKGGVFDIIPSENKNSKNAVKGKIKKSTKIQKNIKL